MTRNAFVCFCKCGATIYAAAIDDGDDDPDTGAMVLEALRKGRPVGYMEAANVTMRQCECIAVAAGSRASARATGTPNE